MEAHSFAANGKSAREIAFGLGLNFKITPKVAKQDQINAGRSFMGRCWFDKKKTEAGRQALLSYHFKYDDNRKCFGEEPYHDWSSNGADAFMQLAVGHKFAAPIKPPVIEIGYMQQESHSVRWLAV